MPSAALQSRISTFESLGGAGTSSPSPSSSSSTLVSVPAKSKFNGSVLETPFSPPITPRQSSPASPSPSPPNLGHKTSLIDLKDWIVDDGPSPPHRNGFKPLSAHTNGNSNGNGHSQWATDTKHLTAPLINLETSPTPKHKSFSSYGRKKAPPLPPRKPSFSSLKSAASIASLNSNNGKSSSHRGSLTVQHVHTYPPLKIDPSRPRNIPGHAPASSISSFHSVSLSSDTDPSTPGSITNFIATYPIDQDRDHEVSMRSNSSEADSISLGESYEEVSISSLASPATERMITRDWEKAMLGRAPPKLPQRPASSPSSTTPKPSMKPPPLALHNQASTSASYLLRPPISSASSSPAALTKRRPPPPPPPSRSSDRSSIQSTSTSRSTSSTYSKIDPPWSLTTLHAKTKRPTPVPPAARQRYESVFNANVVQQRRAEKQKAKVKPALLSPAEARGVRRAAGWRGLSVDLIMGDQAPGSHKEDEEEIDEVVGSSDRLEGCFVRSIWVKSKLNREKLNEIW
jgi:hypothetical protein